MAKKKLPITERVKNFNDVCVELGTTEAAFNEGLAKIGLVTPTEESDEDDPFVKHIKAAIATIKLRMIAQVLNEGWTPDWSDYNQYKYTPYFEANDDNTGLVFLYVDDWFARTDVGSRLCFVSRDIARYAATQFIDIYTDFLN
ncbi:MAG: hypothetical protein WCG90_08330 [Chitinophagia bacterium]